MPIKLIRRIFNRILVIFFLCSVNMVNATTIETEGFIAVNGASLYYKSIGEGEPLVVLHGGPGLDHSYFLPQMENLTARYKLIFYDQRGCGKSSVDVDSNSINMDQFVEDLEQLRTYFKLEKMNLFGHSFGGLLAMRYAIKYPGNIKSLMLINSTPASSAWRDSSFALMSARKDPETTEKTKALMETEAFKNKVPDTMAYFFRLLFKKSFYLPERVDELSLHFQSSYAKTNKLMNMLFKDSSITYYDLNPDLKKLKLPVLIIGSEADIIPPMAIEELHSTLNGSQYVFLEACGHFPFIEQPEQLLKAIDSFFSRM